MSHTINSVGIGAVKLEITSDSLINEIQRCGRIFCINSSHVPMKVVFKVNVGSGNIRFTNSNGQRFTKLLEVFIKHTIKLVASGSS